jgi:uncharacterized protein YecE (DUF72 family)
VERYRYLYKEDELRTWAQKVKTASQTSQKTFAIFNNCYQNFGIQNAMALERLLQESHSKKPSIS